jgi:hypothetical protein
MWAFVIAASTPAISFYYPIITLLKGYEPATRPSAVGERQGECRAAIRRCAGATEGLSGPAQCAIADAGSMAVSLQQGASAARRQRPR